MAKKTNGDTVIVNTIVKAGINITKIVPVVVVDGKVVADNDQGVVS